ncbi:hypothetical protein FJV41_40085 [Myxococcus llanfairpwllgwyngyllgogerychwyrndrobwllllantysiliogogogochensis]|uniref:Uncharacterized protein n=1 Tax=Myxococcus llanfairpwllgwyngyllgogerychwyrndrobwllllantysiliogogogochensis TaxID=2590453 RepID=A0A540WMR3_9BACT|nr:hypothetical protein [Myxococcus llanfairpwllgwyngyllgogerychwyrndrobwllllantysiliogogogochensis]TQF10308.1 hypothetical protein FJV41_40085 [Myxococcus llanfairpwllgwyngyllgogerychwyrndrobwllllantysiliogogogochensis]
MKAMSSLEPKVGDSLRFLLDGALGHRVESDSELTPFLEALEAHAEGWMPDVVKGSKRRKYSRASIKKALEERRDEHGISVAFYRAQPSVELTLDLDLPPSGTQLSCSLSVQPLSLFSERGRCLRFVEMVRTLAAHYLVDYAMAHGMADRHLSGAPYFGRDGRTSRKDGFDTIYEVFWLNVFGPKLVEMVGRERMLSTPAHLVEELPNGSVLLVLWPTAADFASEEARVVQARAHVHLRPDLDFDTVLSTLRERSAAFVPVEPRFHPDVAPFLARLPDEFSIGERQRKIAELNAFLPPAPEEWLPAALPSDVENPERVLADYGVLSEGLVAALHTQVPSIMDETPESLTDLDFYFWRENFPERYMRELIDGHTAPALGAYLGEVLVRRLGGTWVPRQKREESQVRVGHRVWLPFLRARRYMQSRQSLLDYSLTQLFGAAAKGQAGENA